MSLTPKVSVVIPIHGISPFLEEAVKSVLDQTFKDWELLLVLDRASSEVKNICEDFAREINGVTVLASDTPGVSAALNLGIRNSRAELIARLDADDVMQPGRLTAQVAELQIKPWLVAVGSQITRISATGEVLSHSNFPQKPKTLSSLLPFVNVIAHPSVTMRRDAFQSVNGYDGRLEGVEDYHLWLKLMKVGRLANLKERHTLYRVHEQQTTAKKSMTRLMMEAFARLDIVDPIQFKENSILDLLSTSSDSTTLSRIENLEKSLPRNIRKRLESQRFFAMFSRLSPGEKNYRYLPLALAKSPVSAGKALLLLTCLNLHFSTTRVLERPQT